MVPSLCIRWRGKGVGSVHSCQWEVSETGGRSEVSVDHRRIGRNEVEGRGSSETVGKGCASE